MWRTINIHHHFGLSATERELSPNHCQTAINTHSHIHTVKYFRCSLKVLGTVVRPKLNCRRAFLTCTCKFKGFNFKMIFFFTKMLWFFFLNLEAQKEIFPSLQIPPGLRCFCNQIFPLTLDKPHEHRGFVSHNFGQCTHISDAHLAPSPSAWKKKKEKKNIQFKQTDTLHYTQCSSSSCGVVLTAKRCFWQVNVAAGWLGG